MLMRSVPGIGAVLALVILQAIHGIDRLPRGQDRIPYCRMGQMQERSRHDQN
jgi:hypothetical protein